MTSFWRCFVYLAVLGILSHFFGQALPRRWFLAERAPWRDTRWENGGRFWDKCKVRRWMNYLPDMSRIMPDMVPKRIDGIAKAEAVDTLVRESCVAELVHDVLIVTGFACVLIWKGTGGWVISLLFAFGNIPFIVIQRYNRPRLVRLHAWLLAREQKEANVSCKIEQSGEVTEA